MQQVLKQIMNLKNIFNSRDRIIKKRIDYWQIVASEYDNYLTELGLKCVRLGIWDIYFEHRRRHRLIINVIHKLKKLKQTK